ncbi:DUF6879 family protein [Streptomyces ipomoeae]|uniref:DUF6879 domain-containing protein n=2 Tax=Streptomyces ipomoeae TaxID=103232 RepID=L1L8R0_9ACTN|nr:DUF6879 family protein [Streptomyces ipomoeae]EKX69189.1 hypothetical protein STRIP9103_05014 [Streptomyces ipomoeae 91-03]MDX2699679.1 hypothetical protein [Streptomyces ipomoeae]MDX2845374.1 hypothetical protein [Streptomyces ipomoeae]
MARRLRFNGTGSGVNGCPSIHEDLDTGEVVVHGPPLSDPDDVARLRHLGEDEVPIVVPRELLVDFGPKEVNRVPDIIGLDEFDQLFTRFEHTAWRLETRRRYASDEITSTYAQFTRGEPVNWDGVDAAWCAERREQTALGKRFERVRVVDAPPTIGQLYLLDNARRNSTVGETIFTLRRADADRVGLPQEDFWIFDSRLVALLNFDDADNLVNVELIREPAAVLRYAMARDAAMHHAVPYDEFAAELTAEE